SWWRTRSATSATASAGAAGWRRPRGSCAARASCTSGRAASGSWGAAAGTWWARSWPPAGRAAPWPCSGRWWSARATRGSRGRTRLTAGASGAPVRARWAAGRARDAVAAREPVVERARHSWLTRPQALALLAGCLGRLGRPGEAIAAAREAHELLGRLGGVEAGEVMVRLSCAEALWASGAHPAARQAIEEARDHLLGEASHLPREDWRACFLSRVWENARILELADAYQERRDGGLTRRPRPEAAARP